MLPPQTAVETGLELARALLDSIAKRSFDGVGYTRAAYGEGEQVAHDIVAAAARELGLQVATDAALNLSMTLKGSDPGAAPLLVGSHLDAVPQGGNFDGSAGVLAGLATLAAMREGGIEPRRDVAVLAIRAEESAWFGAQHIGSRALLGTLEAGVLDTARRVDTGRTLREHMREAGADLSRIGTGRPLADPRRIRAFLELHIEQGPLLVARGLPVGIVTGIRGNRRCRRITCLGEHGHSGTVPRTLRRDAVMAASELIAGMDRLWQHIEDEEGGDLVLTFGRFATDPKTSSVTTVPGYAEICFDARSHSAATLHRVEAALHDAMGEIGRRRGVKFVAEPFTGDAPAGMSSELQGLLRAGAETLAIPAMPIASGAGHDAGDFAAAGVPAAMIFVRNEHGSHNPREALEFQDFAAGTRLMMWAAGRLACGEAD